MHQIQGGPKNGTKLMTPQFFNRTS